ncbi:MAG: hypothetical protein KDA20_12665 [Phycisphaerales bacterium]|nr:hypothetical protein [Phycisphaerales bacterium]
MHASNCLIEAKPQSRVEPRDPMVVSAGVLARIEPGLGVLMPHASSERLADLRRLARRYNALASGRAAGRIAAKLRLVR